MNLESFRIFGKIYWKPFPALKFPTKFPLFDLRDQIENVYFEQKTTQL